MKIFALVLPLILCASWLMPAVAYAQGYVIHTTYPGTNIRIPDYWDANSRWEFLVEGNRVVSQSHTRHLQAPSGWTHWGGWTILDNGIVLGSGSDGVVSEYFSWDLNGVPHSLGFGDYGFSDNSYGVKRPLDSGGFLYTMLDANMNAFDTVLHADGTFEVLPPSHTGNRWFALDRNSSGTVAGWQFISSTTGEGLRQYANGSYESLPHEYVPTKINERGDIGGYIEEPGFERHFLWLANGQLRVFESMGPVAGSWTQDVKAVLPNGDLVSRVQYADYTQNFWVGKADGSRIWVKDYLGTPTSHQFASIGRVLSNGSLTGSYYNGHYRDSVGFIAVPVPEPVTLFSIGFPIVAFLRKRRK